MSKPLSTQKSNALFISWVVVLLFIPLLSINGRSLQRWVIANLGYNLTAWIIFISLVLAISSILLLIYKKDLKMPFYHLLWVLPIFLYVPLTLGMVEERLHFLVFGAFGVLSMFICQPRVAFCLCLSVAAGDEALQYFLPDRVGDWRDVAMNSLASVTAAFFIWTTFIRTQNQIIRD